MTTGAEGMRLLWLATVVAGLTLLLGLSVAVGTRSVGWSDVVAALGGGARGAALAGAGGGAAGGLPGRLGDRAGHGAALAEATAMRWWLRWAVPAGRSTRRR